ncbi:DUF4136 domain-containing protein [Rhizobacter sp. Root404]|uniref:DUF4136 domain-containing protein n=1 Tax=Rhizobacter sp. Root404 TaxID=1736528 RepID=UPI0006F839FD|nr:DUF4136 domain-containing protein [Rhizobacter sp. Root404]KQW39908.1 hypothetical protein ASC76_00105 [Rhizobacter sp. Root404]
MIRLLTAAAVAVALGGCAAFNNLSNEVSTYGSWPADRQPATFVFERLPSQQAHPERRQQLEDAARGALEAAGFRAAADPNDAQYLMQVGARVTSNDPWIFNDPLFWRGAAFNGHPWRYGRGYWGPGWGWGWGSPYESQSFEREVALLIRDRRTGQLLYEARANNNGPSPSIDYLLPAMFEAALKDFPNVSPAPRSVTTQISKKPPA